MVFMVGIPIVFGFANYLVPLMIGARDLAFPRLNAFGFWVFLFGGLLLYFSFWRDGLYGAGSAPDVGWFAYAPLTGRAFSPATAPTTGTLSILVMGFGTVATSINLIATTLAMRCRGMSLERMPLYVWMMLVVSGMTVLALPPLSAAQIMLLPCPRPHPRAAGRGSAGQSSSMIWAADSGGRASTVMPETTSIIHT